MGLLGLPRERTRKSGQARIEKAGLALIREKNAKPKIFLSFLGYLGSAVLPPYSRMC